MRVGLFKVLVLIATTASGLSAQNVHSQSFPYFSIKAGTARYGVYNCQQDGGNYYASYYVDFTNRVAEFAPPPIPGTKRGVKNIQRLSDGGFSYVEYVGGEPLITASISRRQGADQGIYNLKLKIEMRTTNYTRIVSGTCTGYGRPELPREAEML